MKKNTNNKNLLKNTHTKPFESSVIATNKTKKTKTKKENGDMFQ